MARILITGARGMLGTDLCQVFAPHHTLQPTDLDTLDVRQPAAVFKAFEAGRPDVVIHLAALTNVDECEAHPEQAYQSNAVGTQLIALACQKYAVELVYVSTLAVFDGAKDEAYTEFDVPAPVSHYARSKYQGELSVQSLLQRSYIVRAGWMFGGGARDKKFVAKIIEQARHQPQIEAVTDKFGSPTYTRDLAAGLLALLHTGWYGTYHLVNTGAPASRYEVARRILEFAGIADCEVSPVSSAHFPLSAPRPRMEAGRNLRAELLGLPPLRPWPEALREYIHDDLRAQ